MRKIERKYERTLVAKALAVQMQLLDRILRENVKNGI
jgi:hypothetical protein